MDYAVFTPTEEIKGPKVVFFSPKRRRSGRLRQSRDGGWPRSNITNTCAANVLGLVQEEHFSYGNVPSARKALQALADYCQTTVEDIAEQIMQNRMLKSSQLSWS